MESACFWGGSQCRIPIFVPTFENWKSLGSLGKTSNPDSMQLAISGICWTHLEKTCYKISQGQATDMDWTLHTRDLYIGKNQKLFQNQNSKWRNFAKAKLAFIQNLVSITDMTYSYHTVFNPYFELDFQNDQKNVTFFTFLLE